MAVHYQDDYQDGVSRSGAIYPARWRWHLRGIMPYKTRGAVLDIGCSSGGFLASLKGQGWDVHGIEFSAAAAERARIATGGTIFNGDVLAAEFRPHSFDLITCMDVLEHLYDPRAVLGKVSEWLKPDGVFYVFVPNIHSWEARAFGSYWYGLDLPRHLHHFSTRSLKQLATTVGLQTISMHTPPTNYLEESTRIVVNDIVQKAGLKSSAINWKADPNIGWKIVRKGIRLTVEQLIALASSRFERAPGIQAVFGSAESGVSLATAD